MKGITGLIQRFQNLRELHVGQCHSLMNLLTLSMAKHLVKLTTLTVEDCGMVKEIVSVEEICVTNGNVIKEIGLQEDEGEKISNDKIELFPHLSNLTLKNLPNLTSFCTIQGYTFNWPLLSKVVVSGCPGLEAFTLAVSKTPMLKEVETDSEKYPLMKHRDATIQLISKDKDSGADIGEAECYKLKQIDGCDATEFSLKKITINGCPKLGPSFYIPLLHSPQLWEADITFESQKVRVLRISYFPPVLFMSIDGMENLMDMLMLDGKSTPPEYFSRIRSLELQNFVNFPAAAAWLHVLQSLPKLENLDITSCGSAEVIFGFEQGLNVKQLPHLKVLKVTSLQKLTCIWMKGITGLIQRFQNLRELHVGQCHSLRNLLTPSMAKHLVNLTTLMVENCSMVKEIVSVEEICVTKGKVIEEIGVQEDEGEKISNETIQLFPQLSNLTLKNLPNLVRFCSAQGLALNWLLVTEVVVSVCPRLKEITLPVSKTQMLKEHGDATIQLISKEKDARIDIGEAECYKQDAKTDLMKQLEYLKLRIALSKHLKQLHLDNCSSLQRVFSLSTTARSVLLPQLNELDIRNCSMMEEIFAKEEICDEATPSASAMINISSILFPKLTALTLENNANLKWIFKGIEAYDATSEFSLVGITINGCPKFGPSHYIPLLNSPILRKADIAFESQKVSVSTSPMCFPQNFMSIDGMESLMDMLILDEKSTPGYFSQIHSFELRNLNFPAAAAWMHLIQSLPKLEKLSILSCGSVEVIFVFEQGLNVMQLPPLTELRVTNLEKLTCIWMKGIPEILIQRFENLRELYVGQCHNLKNLLTHSIAKHLLNLKRLTVENCSMVKEIVSVEEKCVTKGKMIKEIGVQEDEGEVIGTETIKFPRVKHLTFRNLPNLTSFCATPGYTSDWPSLKKVVVTGCPRLETFTLVVPSTPMLKNVETQSKKYPLIEDLNATINQILKEKGSEVGVEGTVTQEHNDLDEEDENLSEFSDELTCTEEESDEEWT